MISGMKFWLITGAVVVLAILGLVVFVWEWLGTSSVCRESGSTTIRNLALAIGGSIAIGIAIWRNIVADHQAKAAHLHAQTSLSDLLDKRFQKGAEMLRDNVLFVRVVGVDELQRLAENYPEQYHVKIMRLFCDFVRRPTPDDTEEQKPDIRGYAVREDVQAVMRGDRYPQQRRR